MKFASTEISAWTVTFGITILLCSGCSRQQLDRIAVNGSVTQDSEPLVRGLITFLPTEGTEGPSATAVITDGKYEFGKTDGPLSGHYKVMIVPQAEETSMSEADLRRAERQPAQPWSGIADVSAEEHEWDFDITQ